MFARVCSLGNVCNMAPRYYGAECMPPSCLPLAACSTPCIRSWPPLHGFWPPSSRCAIASIQESFYPLRGRTRSGVNSKPWITSSRLAGGHLPKTMKLNLSTKAGQKSTSQRKYLKLKESPSERVKNLEREADKIAHIYLIIFLSFVDSHFRPHVFRLVHSKFCLIDRNLYFHSIFLDTSSLHYFLDPIVLSSHKRIRQRINEVPSLTLPRLYLRWSRDQSVKWRRAKIMRRWRNKRSNTWRSCQ